MNRHALKMMALDDASWAERGTRCLRRGTAARLFHPKGSTTSTWRAMNTPVLGCTNETGRCGCQHAEPRVLFKALSELGGLLGLTLITTLSPCTACANLIAAAGMIDEVYYLRPLVHDMLGLQILEAAEIWREQL